MENKSKILEKPFTSEEIEEIQENDGYFEGVIRISLNSIVTHNLEEFLDILSEKLVGTSCGLNDISYHAVGAAGGDVFIRVGGFVSEDLLGY